MTVLDELAPLVARVDERLERTLTELADGDSAHPPARLREAMAYSLSSGGKRVRPLLVLHAAIRSRFYSIPRVRNT